MASGINNSGDILTFEEIVVVDDDPVHVGDVIPPGIYELPMTGATTPAGVYELPTLAQAPILDGDSSGDTSSSSDMDNIPATPPTSRTNATPSTVLVIPSSSDSGVSGRSGGGSGILSDGAIASSSSSSQGQGQHSLLMDGLKVHVKKNLLNFAELEKRATEKGDQNLLQIIKLAKDTLNSGIILGENAAPSAVMETALCVFTAIKHLFTFKRSQEPPVPEPPQTAPGRASGNAIMKLKRSLMELSASINTVAALAGGAAAVPATIGGGTASSSTSPNVVTPAMPAISISGADALAGAISGSSSNNTDFRRNYMLEQSVKMIKERSIAYLKKFREGEYSFNFDVAPKEMDSVNETVVKHFGQLMGSWETLFHEDLHYRDWARERLRAKIQSGDYVVDMKTQGVALWVQYKPMELVSDMLCSVLLELMSGDLSESVETAMKLKKALRDQGIYRRKDFSRVYQYLENLLRAFVETMFITNGARLLRGFSFQDGNMDWSVVLKNKISLLTWLMEHTLKRSKGWTLVGFPDASEIFDVEWLIEFAAALRDQRMKGPFPDRVSKKEKDYVKKAMRMEPENPFVILALLDIISAQKKTLSLDFETACRNLAHRFPQSCYIQLRIAKFYLVKGRNRTIAVEHLRRAVTINPTHSEVNLLCAKHICGRSRKVNLGVKHRETFFRLAMTTDLSNSDAAVAYFSNALGCRKNLAAGYSSEPSLFDSATTNELNISTIPGRENGSSLHPSSTTLSGMLAVYGERYSLSVEIILSASYALAWSDEVRAKLLLFSALNYYLVSDYGGALEVLVPIYKKNTVLTMIKNLDYYREKYGWDSRLNFVGFRRWLVVEYDDILEMEAEERLELRQQREAEGVIVDEDSDDAEDENEDMNGSILDQDDKIKEMLIYLLQVL